MTQTTIYGKPNCAQCMMTKKVMTELGVPFTFIENTPEDMPEKIEEIKAKGYSSLPFIESPQGEWAGFRPDKIKALV